MTPKVSVILPVYNEEKYIHQCLDSLRNQTLSEIEIICVDDGSTDESLTILRNYEKSDDRIMVITQKNQYAGVARNNGMKHASGKYLLFLDSDDFFEPDMLEKLFLRAEQDRLDITLCHSYRMDDRIGEGFGVDSSQRDAFFPKHVSVFSGTDMKCGGIFQAMVGWAWDKLFRTDFVRAMGYEFPDFRTSEDGFFVFMLVALAERIGVLDECLVWHRIYNGNSLSNTRGKNWENVFRMLEMIHIELISRGIYDIYEQSFISWAVEMQVWHLTSLYDKEAFFETYKYIQEHTEPEFKILQYHGEFLCGDDFVKYYEAIIKLEPEQFLLSLLKERDDTISKSYTVTRKKGWVFPYDKIPKGAKLIIYAAGVVGHSYYEQLKATGYCREVHIVDQNYQKYRTADYPVDDVEKIRIIEFDYILIAIQDDLICHTVRDSLINDYNVPAGKIVWGWVQ
ncbi:MAG: glycosyltransferase [Lachnospiraceae bacterium]|nr:glycosyltransferase [Lachnospiraceae bacterium]